MKTIDTRYSHWKDITDAEYITGLKQGDNEITGAFFNGLCNYMLNDISVSLMHNVVDYDALANELYLYLSVNDWHKLDTFSGINGCTLRSWLVRLSWRFFMTQRERLLGKQYDDFDEIQIPDTIDALNTEISMDVQTTLARMNNPRYVQILVWMLVDGYGAEEVADMMQTSVANVYNIKHRAIVQFIETFNKNK